MSIFDSLKELLGGAQEHIQNFTDNEAVQSVKDKATEVTQQAEEATGGLGESVQNAVDGMKEKLGK